MRYKKILVTGGAGFAGSNIAAALKRSFDSVEICVLDNLYRRGSELNLPRLERLGIRFVKGDVRSMEDLAAAGKFDCLIECSAEPSVMAGGGDSSYLVHTNLNGAVNCAELCGKYGAPLFFISTSRVYPWMPLRDCKLTETESRLMFAGGQPLPGLSPKGVSEKFPLDGPRSLYGATKLSAEIMIEEFRELYKIPAVVNRCGVIAGPWQFGKVDQGIAAFWTGAHILGCPLKYIGFGGVGKQTRDFMHIDDLIRLLLIQLGDPERYSGRPFNAGGGTAVSASLRELTEICAEVTGRRTDITSDPVTRHADIPVYVTDHSDITALSGWRPEKGVRDIISDIHRWMIDEPAALSLF
jgi:CDP-paratose 2-epimerase